MEDLTAVYVVVLRATEPPPGWVEANLAFLDREIELTYGTNGTVLLSAIEAKPCSNHCTRGRVLVAMPVHPTIDGMLTRVETEPCPNPRCQQGFELAYGEPLPSTTNGEHS